MAIFVGLDAGAFPPIECWTERPRLSAHALAQAVHHFRGRVCFRPVLLIQG